MFMILFIGAWIGTVGLIYNDCNGKFELNNVPLYKEDTKCKTTAECYERRTGKKLEETP